ncbi:hypothetical protein GPECTOR_26g529 [Gonium pectorale]|uniref:Uncharacterized protein n=1 Tax=Gonium pectorale TaxID=33097 RepID=A0A150GFM2_GONPE|nr:hypothetical protein GPECTOR_26g529 [Gonium pectorale]|eukprot:KXZ48626.1 hypothetical protein GPECTOR_26g529 [Gonium pectorale]
MQETYGGELPAGPSVRGDYNPDDPLAALGLGASAAAAGSDVVGAVPRYAAPNLASCLPVYTNQEQDFIVRTFGAGNYDMLRHLPDDIRVQQVNANRTARQEAVRTFLLPGTLGSQLRLKSNPENQQGLFAPFEYIPSRYSLAAELASKERVANETTRLAVGRGQEWKPVVAERLQRHQEIGPKSGYVYLAGPHEDTEDIRQAARAHDEAGISNPPFVPAGTQKLSGEVPTRLEATSMMRAIKKALEADWEGAVISIFENEHDCWVICFQEATVDGLEGLAAYMNVFVRTHALAIGYKLVRVVEYWGSSPGDGCVYFVVRPPWVAPDRLDTFFKLHPEERDWRTSFPVVEMEAERRERRKALEAGDDELEVESRLRQLSIKSQHAPPPNTLASQRSVKGAGLAASAASAVRAAGGPGQ